MLLVLILVAAASGDCMPPASLRLLPAVLLRTARLPTACVSSAVCVPSAVCLLPCLVPALCYCPTTAAAPLRGKRRSCRCWCWCTTRGLHGTSPFAG